MNLVSIIMQMLTPELLGKLTSGLGGGSDQSMVQKAAGGAIPAILAGLAGVAGQSGGGSLITNAISKLDPGMMGNLANVLGGAGQGALANTGANILGSLLGNSALGTLAGALGKFSGLGGTASTGLLGALVPIILGSLGQQQKSMGLDAGGVAKLLTDQKSNIQAAMPADFSKLLAGSGLLDGVMGQASGMASSAASTASSAARSATSTMSSAASSMTTPVKDDDSNSGGANWLPWLIGLVALALIAWFLLGRGTPTAPTMAPTMAPATTSMAPAGMSAMMPAIKVGDLDVGATMNGVMDTLKTTLPTITDAATANAAMPKLTDAGAALDKVNGVLGQMSADNKKAMAGFIAPAMAALSPMMDMVTSNAAAGPIVKPVMDAIKAKLTALGSAS